LRIISNTAHDRIINHLSDLSDSVDFLDILSNKISIYALDALIKTLSLKGTSKLIHSEMLTIQELMGKADDRFYRNKLDARYVAKRLVDILQKKFIIKSYPELIPQGALIFQSGDKKAIQSFSGSLEILSSSIGTAPAQPMQLIQASESESEANSLLQWFNTLWSQIPESDKTQDLITQLQSIAELKSPYDLYAVVLSHLFDNLSEEMDEEKIIRGATGIRNTKVWQKLYKFQKDAVIGAIDKLNRYGGCIIADSVGLGKTFEALAVIKYHELRNDRVLVLCPKRLRDNWTLFKANDRRNMLGDDRLNYDVLNHTDLSRDGGTSGDVDLSFVNWGNYDLVVIDESHNFRNKNAANTGSESRYQRLMRKIIREGVKTRVLMLSATPVNNRLADLKNQIAFITEGNDLALHQFGIASINITTQLAQKQFNRWLDLPDERRTPTELIDMLGFDYFKLLDLLTIARSRRHIEKYYGTAETGEFPERLKPINIKSDVDTQHSFPSIENINLEIRRLNLAAHAPLRYVLGHKKEAYDRKYNTEIRGGESFFRHADREESLIHLMRVNMLKRMESAVSSFALTIQRQLRDVESILERIDEHDLEIEELDIEDIDFDDPLFESLTVGKKVKVLLQDMDLIRWKQDLTEDRNRLKGLYREAKQITASRDAKLNDLKAVILQKCNKPINEGNKKILIFTAFVDTAVYLYDHIASWAQKELQIYSGLVTGTGRNRSNHPTLHKDFSSILSAFSPRSKERPEELNTEGELDILIATDCISEGQNLQDCDWMINYDIHWNPVRIIQRFGRIDRIGSVNTQIQLVNFWPNMELDEYINLEQRVSGRMVLLDISATGEENIIERDTANRMNDLEYRRKQLLKLQDTVIDLEDLSTGVSITDLTLNDFRIDLAEYLKEFPQQLEGMPPGITSVLTRNDVELPAGMIFCLKAEGAKDMTKTQGTYPLHPYYLIYVNDDATILLSHTQVKKILDALKRSAYGRDLVDTEAMEHFDKLTQNGRNMKHTQDLLSAAFASISGKSEETAMASLFSPGGTFIQNGEISGISDFEVIAWMAILPKE